MAASYLIIQGLQSYGLLVLRLVLGFALVFHGLPKISTKREEIATMMRNRGVPGPVTLIAGYFEFIGGLLLLIGLGTQIVGLLVALEALASVYFFARFMGRRYIDGYEVKMAYVAIGLALFFLGAGVFSIDRLIIPYL